MNRAELMKQYDALTWELAETYGASTGFGSRQNAAGLHRKRQELSARILTLREQIIND